MHKENVDRVLSFVDKGLSVRIVGAPGSGRTSLTKGVVARLQEDGATVYPIFATPALNSVPFAGILSLGLDLRSRTIGILSMADLLSAQLARTESHLMAIDGIENLDRESLAVVNILRTRADVPLVVTMNDSPFRAKTPAGELGCIPEATVALPSLGYEQINRLILNVLGTPAEVDVVAHVLTKSGGNLRLAVRIIESAVLSERLVLKDDRWCMSGGGLMNEHLNGAVELLLQGLDPEEVRALNKISLLGPTPVSQLAATVGEETLDNLEVGGLVSVVTSPEGAAIATVFPPIVDDYLRAHTLGFRRILQTAVTGHVDAQREDHSLPETTDDLLSEAVFKLRTEMSGNHAAATRYFQQRLESVERHLFQTWENDKSLSNAVAILGIYWGAPTGSYRIQEILRLTDTNSGAQADLFFFTMTCSWWKYTTQHDLPGAIEELRTLAFNEPLLRPDAEAFIEFLNMTSGGLDHADRTILPTAGQNPYEGINATIQGLLELYRLNPDGALGIIGSSEGPQHLRRFDSFIHGMALFSGGRVEEALVLALESRRKALQDVDQFVFVSQSYIAALSLIYHGLFCEAEYLMGRAFSLGRPALLVNSLHEAMVHLSSIREIDASGSRKPTAEVLDVGPLPGIGTGLQYLVASPPASAKAFDHRASTLVEKSLNHGFVLEAMHTAIFALGLLPGPRTSALLHRILGERGITVHNQLLAVADAAIKCDPTLLQHLLDTYVLDGDTYQIAMLLRGAEQRWQLSGEPATAAEIRRVAKEFTARFQPVGTLLNFRSEPAGSSLTQREIEVALVAGLQSNQDIAEIFGISVRTVESHISNALRKTDTTTRKQLADLIQNAPKAVLSGAVGSFPDHSEGRPNARLES
ncbi:LuxR C-terminal-related transcriptional regulator [Paenarthrobacter sp. NPDC056912]|uniref:helix-turn-helix transcriptional regulator n=1 Tax=Paenarthrobacter sp. NPDC056912 TaxID=3345965 RepID=UPI00366C7322